MARFSILILMQRQEASSATIGAARCAPLQLTWVAVPL
ncbi:hypothetical protein LINPERHAP2_LOCUS24302 [Linum perenne]